MAFTGVLGSIDANLGGFVLGSPGSSAPDFDPHISQSLTLTQTVGLGKSVAVSASNTLTLTQVAFHFAPLVPIVGYSGGQTRYVHVRDITLGQNLYELNPDTVFNYPASVTKLMTALLIYEYKNAVLSSTVTFTTADVTISGGASVGGFAAGDTCTWTELLYAIFVASAGDACQCAARIIGHEIYVAAGSTGNDGMARFVDTMNARAAALGMTNTTYYDPWGFSGSGSYNKISARDLSTVAATAYSNATLVTISGTATKTITTGGGSPQTLSWTNVNRFINGPTANQSGIADAHALAGKVGEWLSGGSWLNMSQLWTAPNGNLLIISTMGSESYQAMTFDQQGIIYSLLRDWPYLEDTVSRGDSYFTTVKMLVGADGSITDESNVGRTLTATSVSVGSPVIKSTGGLTYNAQTDIVTAADAADLEIGSGDATIEVWYTGPGTVTGSPTEYLWFGKLNSSFNREFTMNYYFPGHDFNIFASGDGTSWASATVLGLSTAEEAVFFNGAPRHICLIKSGSTWAAYINGERQTSTITTVGTVYDGPEPLSIGASGASAIGQYDDFRYTVGVDRYTANKVTLDARKFPRVTSPDQSASSTLILSHQVALNVTYNRTVAQSLTLTQAAYKVTDVTASSTLTLSQTATVLKIRLVSAADSLVLTQSVDRSVTYNRTINQGMILTHSALRNMYYARSVANTLALAQNDTEVNSKLATNTLVLSQTATEVYSHGAAHAIELTQTVSRLMTYIESIHDFLGVFHTLSRTGQWNKTPSNSLVLTQQAVGINTKFVSSTLHLSDLAIGEVVTPAFDLLNMFDRTTVNHTSNLSPSSVLILNQSVSVQRSLAVFAFNAFGMNQFARGNKVLTTVASNTLALTEALVQRYWNESITHTLSLTQAAIENRIIPVSVADTLALDDELAVAKTLVRSVTDVLIFQNSFQKYIGIASQPYIAVPVVQGVLVKKKCNLILESPGLSIVLPCPQFGDSEAGSAKLNVKRAMDGTRRVYRRDSPTSKLKYDFIMDRRKAIELRNFIIVNNSSLVKLTNHKGEIWYVLLTNSPFSFTEEAYWDSSWGNKSTTTLEFEGTRVN